MTSLLILPPREQARIPIRLNNLPSFLSVPPPQGAGPYTHQIKQTEDDIAAQVKKVNDLAGIKESDTGLAVPSLWDLTADKQALQTEEPLQVCLSVCLSHAAN